MSVIPEKMFISIYKTVCNQQLQSPIQKASGPQGTIFSSRHRKEKNGISSLSQPSAVPAELKTDFSFKASLYLTQGVGGKFSKERFSI